MKHIVCQKERCTGCLACVVACIDQHYEETDEHAVSARIYEKEVSPRTGMVCYKTRSCLHCEDAPCVKACPAGALVKNPQGFVIPYPEKCIGCHACEKACGHQIPQFDSENRIVKCDGCASRIAAGLAPACVQACPMDALSCENL